MTNLQKALVGAGVVVVLGSIVTWSVLSKQKDKGKEVYLAKAARKDVVSAVTATGSIAPRTKVNVQSSVIGEIVKLPVKEGDAVRKGDLLVQVDPKAYLAEVDRLEANLRMGRIAIEQQESTLENLKRTLQRNRSLFKDELVPPQVLEDSELQVKTGEINLKSLKEQVSQAEASLTKAKDDLRKTTIVSAIDGIVTQLNAELGEMTLTGTMNNPGTVIMVVSDMSEVLAEVDVDETRVVQVRPGQSARVVVDAVGETHPYSGRVTEIGGTAVTRSGQQALVFAVKIALDEPDPSLRPGMTAKARIEAKRADKSVTVPIAAVVMRPAAEVEKALAGEKPPAKDEKKKPAPEGTAQAATEDAPKKDEAKPAAAATGGLASADQREVVFKVVDGKTVMVPVKTGISDETDVVLLDGIAEGDTVVSGPYRTLKKLKAGEAVRKAEEKAESEGEEKDAVKVEAD